MRSRACARCSLRYARRWSGRTLTLNLTLTLTLTLILTLTLAPSSVILTLTLTLAPMPTEVGARAHPAAKPSG